MRMPDYQSIMSKDHLERDLGERHETFAAYIIAASRDIIVSSRCDEFFVFSSIVLETRALVAFYVRS